MSHATLRMRSLAKRLIAYDTKKNKSSGTAPRADFPVIGKLGPQLVVFMGNAGFHALLARARALAGAEVPWLGKVQVKADGTLAGLDELEAQVEAGQVSEGRIVLLAQLLGLLQAFIGEILMLRMVLEVWPKLPLDDLDSGERGKHEKRK